MSTRKKEHKPATPADSTAAPESAKPAPARGRGPFECIALVLQGGGALGSYQAGVYQGLAEASLHPDWVAGISIGAINSAIIAGNAPEQRVEKLRGFWEKITHNPLTEWVAHSHSLVPREGAVRGWFNHFSAASALMGGAPGFFAPRQPAPFFHPEGSEAATSFYDTGALRSTLEHFVDFDRVNSGEMRLSVGAVNVRTGNFAWFDTRKDTIRPEHIMASGSLPPGFAATEVDGERYWDGGLVSNTPLQWVVDGTPRQDTLVFQVDLWNARGSLPRNLDEVAARQKEIQYSSRTRAGTDNFARIQRMRVALSRLLAKLPPELRESEEVRLLHEASCPKLFNIVHLIYRSGRHEKQSKDYEFSRLTMDDHWHSGYHDAVRTLSHQRIFERPGTHDGVFVFDVLRDEASR